MPKNYWHLLGFEGRERMRRDFSPEDISLKYKKPPWCGAVAPCHEWYLGSRNNWSSCRGCGARGDRNA